MLGTTPLDMLVGLRSITDTTVSCASVTPIQDGAPAGPLPDTVSLNIAVVGSHCANGSKAPASGPSSNSCGSTVGEPTRPAIVTMVPGSRMAVGRMVKVRRLREEMASEFCWRERDRTPHLQRRDQRIARIEGVVQHKRELDRGPRDDGRHGHIQRKKPLVLSPHGRVAEQTSRRAGDGQVECRGGQRVVESHDVDAVAGAQAEVENEDDSDRVALADNKVEARDVLLERHWLHIGLEHHAVHQALRGRHHTALESALHPHFDRRRHTRGVRRVLQVKPDHVRGLARKPSYCHERHSPCLLRPHCKCLKEGAVRPAQSNWAARSRRGAEVADDDKRPVLRGDHEVRGERELNVDLGQIIVHLRGGARAEDREHWLGVCLQHRP
eukprot:3582885-Rhodomonas_salina.2